MGLVRACFLLIMTIGVGSLLGCFQESPPAAKHPLASDLHRQVAAASNYDASQLDVAVTGGQIVVKVINSNLLEAGHPDRDADAARIAHTLEKEIEARAELGSVQAIHVDYVARDTTGSSSVRDSMDFRRSASGRFTLDVS